MLHNAGNLLCIGLNTTDVSGVCLRKHGHQLRQLTLVLGPSSRGNKIRLGTLWSTATARRGSNFLFCEVGALFVGQMFGDNFVLDLKSTVQQVSWQSILVTENEAIGIVHDLSGIVMDSELLSVHSRLNQARRLLVGSQRLLHEGFIGSLRTDALLIKHVEQTGLSFNQIQDISIVIILDFIERDSLILVFFLDGSEDVNGKLLLKLFVTVVNTKLFETISDKGFKTEDIKKTDDTELGLRTSRVVLFGAGCVIDATHKPQERLGVDFLGKGISGFLSCVSIQGDLVAIISRLHRTFRKTVDQILFGHSHEAGKGPKLFLVSDCRSVIILRILHERKVTKLQDNANGFKEVVQPVARNTNRLEHFDSLGPVVFILHALNGICAGRSNVSEGLVRCPLESGPEPGLLGVGSGK
mmetsp:Transcript_5700/g.13618  ORF Transcript_5700/g.13618 Transcript_5700/m.13618 type:complete len:412 (-) Transcript_5700:213-1448(-)